MKTSLTLHAYRQYSKPAASLDKPEALAKFYFEHCGYSYYDACDKAGYNPLRDGRQIAVALGCLSALFVAVMVAVLVLS